MDMAGEKLKSAKILLDAGQYKDSIGRSYYAIFSAVRAVLAKENVDFSRHSGVIAYFQTGKIDKKYSKYLQNAFQIRNNCDYDDFYLVSVDDAEEQYNNAVEMLDMIREYLN
jgi:uncharacterized protein (UPF0332 family)